LWIPLVVGFLTGKIGDHREPRRYDRRM
jgi:hypothetical protein